MLESDIIKGEIGMVKHIILWKLKDEYSGVECEQIKNGIKEGLESLLGKIPGLVEIKVITKGMQSSNADVMLDSTFEDEAALLGYLDHPEHVSVATQRVRPYMDLRVSMDYIV